MTIRTRPWERPLRELHRSFSLLEQELELLRSIDKSILDNDQGITRPLEDVFIESMRRFSHIHRLEEPLLCYVNLGDHLIRLDSSSLESHSSTHEAPTVIELTEALTEALTGVLSGSSEGSIAPAYVDEEHPLFTHFPNAKTIMLCPMSSPSSQTLCVFLIADPHQRIGSALTAPDFVESVIALVAQLRIAYSHRDRAFQHRWVQELWDNFLNVDLSPTQCFKTLATAIPSFLPSFGPLMCPEPAPQVQILTLPRVLDGTKDPGLVIRGTTGQEPDGTRIAIDRSICGLLLEQSEAQLPLFYDDPQKKKYAKRYKSYLGTEEETPIRTELAVRLKSGDDTIGVVNLESVNQRAFNIHHIDATKRLSRLITPVVAVFERRLAMNANMQASVASSTARYLDGLASVFRHAMATPLLSLGSNIELVESDITTTASLAETKAEQTEPRSRDVLHKVSTALNKAHAPLLRAFNSQLQIATFTEDFIADIADYGNPRIMNLPKLIESAIHLVNTALLVKLGIPITINLRPLEARDAVSVYCSRLLKQHLYSILHNSILSIESRFEQDTSPGHISITVSKYVPPEGQEQTLNAAWVITIRDNGKGVNSTQLSELKRFEPGVRFRAGQGLGHGLVAAQRYISSIGGRVQLDSAEDKFFEVVLYLPDAQHVPVQPTAEQPMVGV